MLQLLNEVSGAFQPGILTALVGVSGAGKTTLMDVLAGRKTGEPCNSLILIRQHPVVKVWLQQDHPHECLAARQHLLCCYHLPCHAPPYAPSVSVSKGICMIAGGLITGDIRVNGYPKVQATFARICG